MAQKPKTQRAIRTDGRSKGGFKAAQKWAATQQKLLAKKRDAEIVQVSSAPAPVSYQQEQ